MFRCGIIRKSNKGNIPLSLIYIKRQVQTDHTQITIIHDELTKCVLDLVLFCRGYSVLYSRLGQCKKGVSADMIVHLSLVRIQILKKPMRQKTESITE